jgi:hypothetical protein
VTNAPEGTQGSGFIELEQHAPCKAHASRQSDGPLSSAPAPGKACKSALQLRRR